MQITAYDLAARFQGLKEVDGATANPAILAMLRLDDRSIQDDATPWCSAFVSYIAWLLNLPRSKSLAARSWLTVGRPITLAEADPGFDVVILSRPVAGSVLTSPGPEVLDAPGHVGFFAGGAIGQDTGKAVIHVLGGNQGNAVSIASFPATRLLGVRRLVG